MSDNFRAGKYSEASDRNAPEAVVVSANSTARLQGEATCSTQSRHKECGPIVDPNSPRAKQWEEASRASIHQPLKTNSDGTYTVKDGDCLSTIAERELHMSGRKVNEKAIAAEVAHIKKLNQEVHPRLANCDVIREGWHLQLGQTQKHDCQSAANPAASSGTRPDSSAAPREHSIESRHSRQPLSNHHLRTESEHEQYREQPRHHRHPQPRSEAQGGDQLAGFAQGILAPLAGLFSGLGGGLSHRPYGGGYIHREPEYFGGHHRSDDYSYGQPNPSFGGYRDDRYYPENSGYGGGYDGYSSAPGYRAMPVPRYSHSRGGAFVVERNQGWF